MLNIYAKRIEKYVLPYYGKINSHVPVPRFMMNLHLKSSKKAKNLRGPSIFIGQLQK